MPRYKCRICNYEATTPRHVERYREPLRCADDCCDGPVSPVAQCVVCSAEIPAERLAILPDTVHCIRCVGKHGPKVVQDPAVVCSKASASGQNGFTREEP